MKLPKIEIRNNRYCYRARKEGKRVYVWLDEAKNEKEALNLAILDKAQTKEDQRLRQKGLDPTKKMIIPVKFTELVDEFLAYSQNNKKGSYKLDLSYSKKFLKFFGNEWSYNITPAKIENYKRWRLDTKTERKVLDNEGNENIKIITPNENTINRELNSLRKLFTVAVSNNHYLESPCSEKKVPYCDENFVSKRIITPEEQGLLFSFFTKIKLSIEQQKIVFQSSRYPLDKKRFIEIIELEKNGDIEGLAKLSPRYIDLSDLFDLSLQAITTGMRMGEITTCEWKNIDFKYDTIELLKTKTKFPRIVPMCPILKTMLLSRREIVDSPFVYPAPKDNSKPYNKFSNRFAIAAKLAKLKGVSFHCWRHSAITRMLENGIDIATISEIVGADPNTLLKVYVHTSAENKYKGVLKLNDLAPKYLNNLQVFGNQLQYA